MHGRCFLKYQNDRCNKGLFNAEDIQYFGIRMFDCSFSLWSGIYRYCYCFVNRGDTGWEAKNLLVIIGYLSSELY